MVGLYKLPYIYLSTKDMAKNVTGNVYALFFGLFGLIGKDAHMYHHKHLEYLFCMCSDIM